MFVQPDLFKILSVLVTFGQSVFLWKEYLKIWQGVVLGYCRKLYCVIQSMLEDYDKENHGKTSVDALI